MECPLFDFVRVSVGAIITPCKLIVESGPSAGTTFEIAAEQTFVIGRGKDSHTQIQDPQMSRVHCRIDWIDGEPWIVDAGSVSGTIMNGQRVARQRIQNQDRFTVGASEFTFLRDGRSREEVLEANPWLKNNSLFAKPEVREKPLQELVGQKLGNYRLDAVIAIGSSGVVFKGTDTDKNRAVAVKVLSPDREAHEEQKERFVRAMKTMLDIQHPHIVQLYGAGKTGPYCWAAMQYIQGDSLTKIIEWIGIGNALQWKDVFTVAVHIGRALQEAEKRKIIHRNVTPKNILRRSGDLCHFLGDLMLAKALEGTQAREITKPGQIVGELHYLPPERTISGSVIDSRSDLYGLGAALYGLITGRPPAQGKSTVELIQAIRNVVPPKPSAFQRDIHPEFESIIMKLLEKSPEDRFTSANSIMFRLKQIAEADHLEMDWANWVG